MPKFAANLTLLFNEAPFLERFGLARAAGFDAVECQFPYAHVAEEIAERLARHRLQLVLHNFPAGDWAAGERGIACDPRRVGEFQDGIERALAYARVLGVRQLNCLAGIRPDQVNADTARATLIDNLRFAARQLAPLGMRVLIEPINTYDIPGFFVSRSADAAELIAATGEDNVMLQYDIYHMQRMEGELANTIRARLPLIAHIQLADTPGRHEPGSGEINFPYLLAAIDAMGYAGWVGCEYVPAAGTLAGLAWREALR